MKMYRNNRIRSIAVLLPWLLLLFIGLACHSDTPTPTGPGDKPPDPEPIFTTTTLTGHYLVILDEGLHSLGHRTDGEEVFYDEPRLWIPNELQTGDTLLSGLLNTVYMRWFEVIDVSDVLETAAGTFEGVARFLSDGYDWADYSFCPGYGLLDSVDGGGRGYIYYFLQSINVTPGGDPAADHFGLAPGNTWSFTLSGSDSEGMIRYEGHEMRWVEGPVTVGGQQALVLFSERTISAYDISGTEMSRRIGGPPGKRGLSPAGR
jgi:hypothetical protein